MSIHHHHQHTVTASMGLIFAAIFARSVSTTPNSILWMLYSSLTILHIYANMQCMKLVAFDHFNTHRLRIVLQHYLNHHIFLNHYYNKHVMKDTNTTNHDHHHQNSTLPSPTVVSKLEPLFFFSSDISTNSPCEHKKPSPLLPIRFGVSFDAVAKFYYSSPKTHIESNSPSSDMFLRHMISTQQHQPYMIFLVGNDHRVQSRKKRKCILVTLGSKASSMDKCKAYMHATIMQHIISIKDFKEEGKEKERSSQLMMKMNNNDHNLVPLSNDQGLPIQSYSTKQAEIETNQIMDNHWPIFQTLASDSGWDLSKTLLQQEGYEVDVM